jgi:uncharacterized protein (DUF1501 family)
MNISNRRRFLLHALSGAIATQLPGWSFAAVPGEARLVVVLLRGALDGLTAVPPVGDPHYAQLHGALAVGPGTATRLDGFFGLHPQLAFCGERWGAGELLPCHAVASPYRDRSHFDGQNVLENGGDRPSGSASGWLNRTLAALPRNDKGLALGQNVPLILRGPAPVTSWAPSTLRDPDEELIERLEDLYSADELLSARLAEATQAVELADAANAATGKRGQRRNSGPERLQGIAATAGRMLAASDGLRVAVMDANGWDTHANQGNAYGQLANRLKSLDAAMRSLHEGLGAAWRDTVVVVLTEFGRTVAINGTRGTDHGTGTAALLLGGAVSGKRVLADWPGLRSAELYEGRDLKPTTSLHALMKGVLRDHLRLPEAALENVFPASTRDRPVAGLVRDRR